MEVIEYMRWAVAQNLAYRIVTRLRDARREENRADGWIQVTGKLPLASLDFSTAKLAVCSFKVRNYWPEVIPDIVCNEPWLRRGKEWHINSDGDVCSEFGLKWRDELAVLIEQHTHGLAAEYAAEWLVNSTRSLLQRHLVAHRHGLTKWAAEWDFWAHDWESAKRQYMQERK